jgi:potassium/hydrogen antiporter
MGVELAFGIAGGVILIGVMANLVSKRIGIPDIPLLIGLGIFLGPLTGLIQASALNQLAPAFAALAITVIVFEGGIHLRIARIAAQAGRATILAIVGYLLSTISVGVAVSLILGWPLMAGILLGSALGGSSSVVVFSLLRRTTPSEKTGALLSLESSLTDVPVLVVTLSLVPLVLGVAGQSAITVFGGIFQSFVIGGALGIAGGVAWLKVLDKMGDEPYKDIATLGFLLGAYAVSSALGGSGVMCALIIGMIMGNGPEIRKLAKLGETPLVEGISRRFHEQISFALTTFFFVYLGLYFSLSDPVYLLVGAAVSAVLFTARYASVLISTAGNSILRMDTWMMTVMYPRGLSNAIMGQVFLTMAFPLAEPLVQVLLSVILTSVISSSLIVKFLPDHLTFNLKLPEFTSVKFPHTTHQRPRGSTGTSFRSAVMESAEDLPGMTPGMVPVRVTYGSFEPLAAFTTGKETLVVDALVGLEEVKRLPTKVKSCQDAKFTGEVDFIIDDLTAFKTLSRLLLVEEYCDRARGLGFRVRLFTFEPQSKTKLVPLKQMRSMITPEVPKKSRFGGMLEAVQRSAERLGSQRAENS